MIDYIFGSLSDIYEDDLPSISIDVNGIGYLIIISQSDFETLPDLNSNVKIYTTLIHKEDCMVLYGFISKDARNLFLLLTSVSGVGPKMAMQILNSFSPVDISNIILQDNSKLLTKAKGVGTKIAQKIVLDLKDKIKKLNISKPLPTSNPKIQLNNVALNEAKDVLYSLGYEDEEINSALSSASNLLDKNSQTEVILKTLLKFLSI